ncbi:MAG: M20/M25/M40 family metallo-hydrolase [Oscillospiraceae bacterium]|nr:M20/M25/M40 family metallo-hydrolase [Oscillospiraceae bacterium]
MPNDLPQGLEEEIQAVLYPYVAAQSISGTEKERAAGAFLKEHFAAIPYFQRHPELYGTRRIPEDPFEREVFWAMRRGEGKKTVVLIHHSDVAGVEDFKQLQELAFRPEKLRRELLELAPALSEDAQKDLESGEFLFGRGCTDMKGGGSVQIALLKRYCEQERFDGNVILLAVPDEENLSAGMRAAVSLLRELGERYGLDFRMMINSEPHQRRDPEKGMFSLGSVGKVLVSVYVRGFLAHAGTVFKGFNPLGLLSRIVEKTEVNMDFSDSVGRECAPPPTWLQLSDGKTGYDVSLPLSAFGLLSVLTFRRGPQEVLAQVKGLSQEAFQEHLQKMESQYRRFALITWEGEALLPWKPAVVTVGELYREAKAAFGEKFTQNYQKALCQAAAGLRAGKISAAQAQRRLIEEIYAYIDDLSPRVVLGLCVPYYPSVSCLDWNGEPEALSEELRRFSREHFGQDYETEHFFTGISDLSYSGIRRKMGLQKTLHDEMPLFGNGYDIPLEDMEAVAMPCINIGPWGKDLHKMTERVWKEDLFRRTPALLDCAVRTLLG